MRRCKNKTNEESYVLKVFESEWKKTKDVSLERFPTFKKNMMGRPPGATEWFAPRQGGRHAIQVYEAIVKPVSHHCNTWAIALLRPLCT